MTAKEAAVIDIKEELSKNNKSFIAYRTNLDGVMSDIEQSYLDAQKKRSVCISGWSRNAKV